MFWNVRMKRKREVGQATGPDSRSLRTRGNASPKRSGKDLGWNTVVARLVITRIWTFEKAERCGR